MYTIKIIIMSGKKEDLRVKITKQLLYDAMFDLLRDNRFENIKVTDICDKAEIHKVLMRYWANIIMTT